MAKRHLGVIILCLTLFIVSCGKRKEEQKTQVKEIIRASTQTVATPTAAQETKSLKPEQVPETKKATEKETPREKIVYPPKVKYLSSTVEDVNKNGKIEPGEKIKIIVKIENIGKGEGKELTVKVDTEGTLITDLDELSIWPIVAGQTKQFLVSFFVPGTAPETVPVHLTFSEGTKVDLKLNVAQKPKTEKETKAEQEKKRIYDRSKKAFQELE